jgi:hypothetical protein
MNNRRDIKEGSEQSQIRLRSDDLRLSIYVHATTNEVSNEEIHEAIISTEDHALFTVVRQFWLHFNPLH